MPVEAIGAAGKIQSPPFNVGQGGVHDPPEKHPLRVEGEKKTDQPERLSRTAGDMEKALKMIHNVDLRFQVHEASGEVMVTVTDESTGKVIREIPRREALDLAERLDEMIGLLFDQKG